MGVRTVAFPAISTGVYRFPRKMAATIAVAEIEDFLSGNLFPEKVFLVAFDDSMLGILCDALNPDEST
jgi:O-acetyl-ADP-ribose deacetylase (regulator of RNase III)